MTMPMQIRLTKTDGTIPVMGTVKLKELLKIPKRKIPSDKNRGSNHPRAKLTEIDVIRILVRWNFGKGDTYCEIANDYDLSHITIRNICKRKSWKHIKFNKNIRKQYITMLKHAKVNNDIKIIK